MVSPFEKLKRLYSFYFAPKLAFSRRKNRQHRSAVFNNSDKLFAPNKATAYDNTTFNETDLNFGLPASGPSALVDFQLVIKTFMKMAKN